MKSKSRPHDVTIAAGEPCAFPAPWERVSCRSNFILIPPESGPKLRHDLLQEFDETELIETALCTQTDDGAIELNYRFNEHPDYILTSRTGKAGTFLVGLKTLTPGGNSISETLAHPAMTGLFSKTPSQVFVAFSQADLALLWSLGLAAIPFDGLSTIGGHELDELCRTLRLRRGCVGDQAGNRGSRPNPIYPVLVNWSAVTVDPADHAEAVEVERHLSKLVQYLGLDLSGGGVWKPTEREIETIKFRLRYGAVTDVVDTLVRSVAKSRVPFGATPNRTTKSEAYFTALAEWNKAAVANDEQRSKRAWDALMHYQEENLITPLIRNAQAEQDPLARNLSIALANVSRLAHQQAPFLGGMWAKCVRDHGFKVSGQLPTEEFRQLDAMIGHIVSITEDIRSCRSRKHKKIPRGPTTRGAYPQKSKPSDSAPPKSPH